MFRPDVNFEGLVRGVIVVRFNRNSTYSKDSSDCAVYYTAWYRTDDADFSNLFIDLGRLERAAFSLHNVYGGIIDYEYRNFE